jgi:hypothetical protein
VRPGARCVLSCGNLMLALLVMGLMEPVAIAAEGVLALATA